MAEQPNLLLIITDQQSYDTLGAYGNNQIQTPNLDSLAEQSYIFENTYVTQPVCSPSRASIYTGLYPHTNGVSEQGNNIEDLQMWVEGPHAQSIYLMNEQDISAYTTFVWDEKIVLIGGDSLRVSLKNNAGNVDIWYNYIDQSWV